MSYAISYVSTVDKDVTENDIQNALDYSKSWNNDHDISGILLYSQGNFFQVLEGDKEVLKKLFSNIKNDKRHYDIIKIFEKEVADVKFDTYQVDFISLDARFQHKDLHSYFSQIKSLNPAIQTSVKYILNKFTEGI